LPAQGIQKAYPLEYNDLSAAMFRFNTKNIGLSSNAMVAFDVESWDMEKDYLSVLIFSLDRITNDIQFISDHLSSVKIIDNIKGLEEENKDILAVVVNAYKDEKNASNQSTISLKVELKEITPSNYRRFTVRLGKVNIQYTYLDGSVENHENVTLELYMPFSTYGSFTGNNFEAGWNLKDGATTDTAFIKAVVREDEEGLTLSAFEFKRVFTYDYEFTYHMKGYSIPLTKNTVSGQLTGSLEIPDIKKNIDVVDWAIRYYNADRTLRGNTHWLSKWELTNDSYFEVIFADPEE
jgi:hypothetical protein